MQSASVKICAVGKVIHLVEFRKKMGINITVEEYTATWWGLSHSEVFVAKGARGSTWVSYRTLGGR